MSLALVAGGSIAGLTTARVLAQKYDQVLILEADEAPTTIAARKGVPQGRHTHGLLKAGSDALTEIFPSIPDQLKAKGAASADFCQEVRWYLNKRWMLDFEGNLPIHFQTRPLLEQCIRDNINAIPNISTRYKTRFQDFLFDEGQNRIIGVRYRNEEGDTEVLEADLVVDAMGRGTAFPKWLEKAGFGKVPLSETRVDLGYASCLLNLRPDDQRNWTSLLIYPTGPDEIKGCTLVRVENNTWLLTLAGYHNDHPPSDREGFLAFAKQLPRPEVYAALEGAEFLSDISLHKFPASIRRHYDRVPNLPEGIIPVGDSNVSLNPLFGQGMTVAFISIRDLSHIIHQVDVSDTQQMARARKIFFARLNEVFKTPWDLAMGQDFRYPQTTGRPPVGYRVKNLLKGLILATKSEPIAEHFFKVVHLIEKETTFYHPLKMIQVLLTARLKK